MIFKENEQISAAPFLNRYNSRMTLVLHWVGLTPFLTQKWRLPIGLRKPDKQTPLFFLKKSAFYKRYYPALLLKQAETGVRITVEWSNPCFGSFFSRVNFGAWKKPYPLGTAGFQAPGSKLLRLYGTP